MFTPGFLLFPLLIPVDSSWQRWQKCLFDGKRWLPHWQGKIPRSESCNPSKYINMWQAKRTWFLSEDYPVSFSCLIFLGAFHTSRLLSDACIFVRFNSLRGLQIRTIPILDAIQQYFQQYCHWKFSYGCTKKINDRTNHYHLFIWYQSLDFEIYAIIQLE